MSRVLGSRHGRRAPSAIRIKVGRRLRCPGSRAARGGEARGEARSGAACPGREDAAPSPTRSGTRPAATITRTCVSARRARRPLDRFFVGTRVTEADVLAHAAMKDVGSCGTPASQSASRHVARGRCDAVNGHASTVGWASRRAARTTLLLCHRHSLPTRSAARLSGIQLEVDPVEHAARPGRIREYDSFEPDDGRAARRRGTPRGVAGRSTRSRRRSATTCPSALA